MAMVVQEEREVARVRKTGSPTSGFGRNSQQKAEALGSSSACVDRRRAHSAHQGLEHS